MPVTIKFYNVSEKKPKHGEDIIWLRRQGSFGYYGYDPRQITVEYQWDILEDGEYNGTSCCYESESDFTSDEATLVILFDGQQVDEDDLWISVEDYWKCFD